VVAGLLALVLQGLGRSSPRLRYGVTIVGLMLMAVLPAVTFWYLRPSSLNLETSFGAAGGRALPVQMAEAIPASAPGEDVGAFLSLGWERSIAPAIPWLIAFWFVGVMTLSVWRLGGWIALQRLRSLGTTPVDSLHLETLARLAKKVGVSRPVRLAKSLLVQTPVLIGFIRPLILVPPAMLSGLSPACLEAILAHELAHVRRHDYIVNLLQTAIETLFFYHPAIWWVSGQIRKHREDCCDDIAVQACESRRVYAEALISLAELQPLGNRLALAAAGDSMHMAGRIRRLLGLPARSTRYVEISIAAVCLAFGAAVFAFLAPQVSAQDAAVPALPPTAPIAVSHLAAVTQPPVVAAPIKPAQAPPAVVVTPHQPILFRSGPPPHVLLVKKPTPKAEWPSRKLIALSTTAKPSEFSSSAAPQPTLAAPTDLPVATIRGYRTGTIWFDQYRTVSVKAIDGQPVKNSQNLWRQGLPLASGQHRVAVRYERERWAAEINATWKAEPGSAYEVRFKQTPKVLDFWIVDLTTGRAVPNVSWGAPKWIHSSPVLRWSASGGVGGIGPVENNAMSWQGSVNGGLPLSAPCGNMGSSGGRSK